MIDRRLAQGIQFPLLTVLEPLELLQVTLKPRLQPAIGPRPTEAPAENRQLP